MTRTVRDNEITERLRAWVDDNYTGWGRFPRLAKESQIRAHRWRDLCGGRQFAAPDMLDFVRKIHPEEADWINTGVRKTASTFVSPSPSALTMRLIRIVKEVGEPLDANIFKRLEEKWSGAVSADDWAYLVIWNKPPTVLMLELICKERPDKAVWIMTGSGDAESVNNPIKKIMDDDFVPKKYPLIRGGIPKND